MDDLTWWEKQIERLLGKRDEVYQLYQKTKHICPECSTYNKGIWVFLKLISLAYYIDIYTNIAEQKFKSHIYIDLFAGPGFNFVREVNEILPGSPLIALRTPRKTRDGVDKGFHKLILFDLNPDYCATLTNLIPRADLSRLDCNSDEAIQFIESALESDKSHFLAFVDPERVEIRWDTLQSLLKMKGDLIINYQISGIGRHCGMYHSEKVSSNLKERYRKELTDFFGSDEWESIPNTEGISLDLYELYLDRLQQSRAEVVPIEIRGTRKGGGFFRYHLLFATRTTKAQTPWLKPIRNTLKPRVEKVNRDFLMKLFDIYRRRQDTLEGYF